MDEPFDAAESSIGKELQFIFKEIQGSSGWSLDRNRPYDGQPHTCVGARGKQLIHGLTMRDIADCFVRGFLHAANEQFPDGYVYNGNICRDDLYRIDLNKIDPGAVIQNAGCEIEKMMGIWPNVPRLKELDDDNTPPSPSLDVIA